jgi:hypothetical protein
MQRILLLVALALAVLGVGASAADAAYITVGQAEAHYNAFAVSVIQNTLHTGNYPVIQAEVRNAGNSWTIYYRILMGDGSHCVGYDSITSYGSPNTTSWSDAFNFCYARG